MPATLQARPSRRTVAILAVAAVIAIAAGAALVWSRSYSPLTIAAYGWDGHWRMVTGTDGTHVAVLDAEPQLLELELENRGRRAVSLEAIGVQPATAGAPRIVVPPPRRAGHAYGRKAPAPFPPGLGAPLFVWLRADCRNAPHRSYTTATKLTVRFRYLRFFSRTETIDAPFPLVGFCP